MSHLLNIGLTDETVWRIKVPPPVRQFDYISRYVRNYDGTPFNPIDYPWNQGICDAYDRDDVRTVTLQMAARAGKTTIAMSLIVGSIANDPSPWMYGNANELITKETIKRKWHEMFKRNINTRHWVYSPRKRSSTAINLTTCMGFAAWSGSATQLADKDPKYLHASEVDKWTKDKSEEADPLDLFLERGLEIPTRKAIIESTPQVTNRSRVEMHLHNGWNCRWQVPCPRCGKYQMLIFGETDPNTGKLKAGGVFFEKDNNGHLNQKIAEDTARYICRYCKHEIDDDNRRPMIQAGLWVPEGQRADKKGNLRGTMKNDGPDASFQLSRLYAPTFTFGQMARAFVGYYQRGTLQNWFNSWLGVTWTPVAVDEEWQEVAKRMSQDYGQGTVPEGGVFLTMAVDVQIDHYVWMVIAWGFEQRGWVVDYGITHSWQDVAEIIKTKFEHADGGKDIGISLTLCDAGDGNKQDEVIDFCRSVNRERGPWVWPCYGASAGAMGLTPYRRNILEADNKMGRAIRNKSTVFGVTTVNTNYWQQWVHNALYKRKPDTPRSLAVPAAAQDDQDLFEQLCNEAPDTQTDMTDHDKFVWVVIDTQIPNDFRDCARYCRCAAEVYTRSAWTRVPQSRIKRAEVARQRTPDETRENHPRALKIPKKSQWVRSINRKHYGSKR